MTYVENEWLPVRDVTYSYISGGFSVSMWTCWKVYTLNWIYKFIIAGSLEVKLPTIWTDEKQRWEESERVEERRAEERRSEKRKSQKKEDAGARKGRKVTKHCVFPMICGSGGSKSRLPKASGTEPSGWREAHFQVKMYKSPHTRTTFGSCDVEKVHAVVARSTFRSQIFKAHQVRTTSGSWDVEKVHAVVARSTFVSEKAKNTSRSDHFWKLRCRKSARGCGAKHISKSKCTKHTAFRAVLEVEMLKKCTLLWREAHFEVNMYKALQPLSTFGSWDVERVHAVARSTFRSQQR